MDEKKSKRQERLEKQLAFSLEIDKEKEIGRQTLLADASRAENDAEHAWHMAIMAYLMQEHSNEKIDLLRTIMMILTHDLVEVYAGDTYAYDEEGKKTQKQRELAAADRLYSILPEDRPKTCVLSGMSLRPGKRRRPDSRVPWTICSP